MYRNVRCPVVYLFLLFMFAVPLNAQAELFMSVSGKVVAADNGTPLSGVTLRLLSPQKGKIAEARSNAQGTFILRDVRKGDYSIWAHSDDPFVVSSNTTIPVTVPDGKNVIGVGIKMQRGGAIKGKIVTSTGKIVSNATILGGNTSATTDATGSFLLKGLSAGPVALAVTAPSIAAKGITATGEIGKIIDVGNVVLPIGAASAIRGTILDSAGEPVSGVIVTATNDEAPGAYAISSSTGSFVITGLSSTDFTLAVVKVGYEPVTINDVSVPSSNLTIRLTPSSISTSGIFQYKVASDRSAVERMYFENIVPASFFDTYEGPQDNGRCPEGYWIGTSIDFSLGIKVPVTNISWGGVFSVGGLACLSSRVEFGFSETCTYGGYGVGAISLGGSGIVARNACEAKDILEPSTDGIVFGASGGFHSGGLAWDYNDRGVDFLSVSYAIGPSFPSIDWLLGDKITPQKLGLSLSSVGRRCSASVLKAGLPEGETLDLGI